MLKEDALGDAVANAERVQDVNLTVVVAEAGNKLLTSESSQVAFFFQILHQGVALFFDIGEVAKTSITLIDIDFTNCACPAKNILIEMSMNGTEMRQTARRGAERQRGSTQRRQFVRRLRQSLRLANTEHIAHHIQAGIEVRVAVVANFIAHSAS
ncbi:hypothetical protein D3C85_1473710 [compost metagenome]